MKPFAIAAALLFGIISVPLRAQDFDLPPELPADALPPELESTVAPGDSAEDEPDDGSAPLLDPFTLELLTRGLYVRNRFNGDNYKLRGSARVYGRSKLDDALGLLMNVRLRGLATYGERFEFSDDVNLDIQELALTWTGDDDVNIEAGRVNIRNGVALGFNPTDWFKLNSLVLSDSQDVSDRRLERLGVLALTAATSIGDTLVQIGYRPRIVGDPNMLITDMNVIGLSLERTNREHTMFVKATPPLGDNISLTSNIYLEDERYGAGLEVSGTIGDALILYGEGFIQHRLSLAAQAMDDGSSDFRRALGADDEATLYAQLGLGGTWSLPEAIAGNEDISLSLEYHFNGAGLTGSQLNALASASGLDQLQGAQLRTLAGERQEPLSQQQIFSRLYWSDVMDEADFSAIAFLVPEDTSGLVQLSAEVPVTDHATFAVSAFSTFGSKTSVYGAQPNEKSVQMDLKFVF